MTYKNVEHRVKNSREYHKKNCEKIRSYVKSWCKENRDKCLEYARRKNRKRTENGTNNRKYAEKREIILGNAKHWRRKFPDKAKNQELNKKYGISFDFYKKEILKQNNKCASCFIDFSVKVKPQVDHCHKTGAFRGILCRNCNIVEGFLTKKADIIECVKKYKEKFNG